jgi:hypothetical protein
VPRSTSRITYPSPSRWNSITLLVRAGWNLSSKIAATSPDLAPDGTTSSLGGKAPSRWNHLPTGFSEPARDLVEQIVIASEALLPRRVPGLREPSRFRLPEKIPLTLLPDVEVMPAALHSLLPKTPANLRDHSI